MKIRIHHFFLSLIIFYHCNVILIVYCQCDATVTSDQGSVITILNFWKSFIHLDTQALTIRSVRTISKYRSERVLDNMQQLKWLFRMLSI